MHVFVTGGTGNIGSAVVAELTRHDHSVTVLARSDASARAAESAGAEVVRGDLTDLSTLREAAQGADGVIHLAFSNDFSSEAAVAAGVADESAALAILGDALIGSGKPIVTVSGTPAVPGHVSTEADRFRLVGRLVDAPRVWPPCSRSPTEACAPPPSDYRAPCTTKGRADSPASSRRPPAAQASPATRATGRSAGPPCTPLDAAVLFRLALEKAPAGTAWHAVADEGDTVLDIVTVIGRRLGVPVESVPGESFGPLGAIFSQDQPSSSVRTQEVLGWKPVHPSLLADLELIEP